MTTTDTIPAITPDGVDLERLGAQLVRNARRPWDRAAAQALAAERTILALPRVRSALVVEKSKGAVARWEGLLGHLYTLSLDEQQRAFLGLVLSMTGMGSTPLTAVEQLDEERLRIILKSIVTLAGNDRIAVGTRM